jgi:hypothetical protein
MPEKTQANQTARAAMAQHGCQRKEQNTDRQRPRREGSPSDASKNQANRPSPQGNKNPQPTPSVADIKKEPVASTQDAPPTVT